MAHQVLLDDFNQEHLIDYVGRRLGGSRIGIELTKEDYLIGIKDAFKQYSRTSPKFCRTVIPVNTVQKKYELPYIGRGVVEVQVDRQNPYMVPGAGLSLNLGDGLITTFHTHQWGAGHMDEIYEGMVYGEMYSRVLSGDFQWEVEDGFLYIANLPASASSASIIYMDSHDYGSVPFSDRDWIERYALAVCKETLGRQRGKYATPGPAGQQFLQDAANLVQEGQEEQRSLREELRLRIIPVPPSWGA